MPKFDPEKNPMFTDPNHVALLIVSPRIKLIEYFDSRFENGDKYIYLIIEYLAYELGGDFKRNEWSYRQNQGLAQQVAVERNTQADTSQPSINFYGGNDGPIHAAIHAWNCLFGISQYTADQARFNAHGDILKKRRRIAVDICANQIILEDKFNIDRTEILVPAVIHNHYLDIRQNEWGDWVPDDRQLRQPLWALEYPGLTHRSFFENITPVRYYTWATLYGRPRCGRTPEEEGKNDDGSLTYPLIKWTILSASWRMELLVGICDFLEIGGKEEKYEEKEGWTEKVLLRAVLAYIDEQMGGFNDIPCDAQAEDRSGEEREDMGRERLLEQ